MPSNAQPIPRGFIITQFRAEALVEDFVVAAGQPMEDGDSTYQNNDLISAPSVFIDGLLLTYEVRSDRRYVSFDSSTKTITINNGGVNEGENVQIFY